MKIAGLFHVSEIIGTKKFSDYDFILFFSGKTVTGSSLIL